MALFDVSDFTRYSELRRQILPSGQTRLKERTTHYSFGLKKQEFAVPLGVDVSILVFENPYRRYRLPSVKCPKLRVRRDAEFFHVSGSHGSELAFLSVVAFI